MSTNKQIEKTKKTITGIADGYSILVIAGFIVYLLLKLFHMV